MQLVKLIAISLPSFAALSPINCSLSEDHADSGIYTKPQGNNSPTSDTEQLHISKGANTLIHGPDRHHRASDYAQMCYGETFPTIAASADNRAVSWDQARMDVDGGTKCCSSLAVVRQGIDAVDEQLLVLLAKRAAYVREATRFKTTHDTVDVPSRGRQVIEQAVDGAVRYRLPQIIAKDVFSAIINASTIFELCVFDSYDGLV